MSHYISTGITDVDLEFKAQQDTGSGGGPVSLMNSLFDIINKTGLDVENALTSPAVRRFMQEAGIKVEQVKVEEKRRKQKSNLLLWGGAAAVVAFIVLRKKS